MNEQKPLVSVVVVTRNRRDDLRTCLKSALAQGYSPLEVLVIDDASSDGTYEMVVNEFPSVRGHREDDQQGLIVRRNEGFDMASGKYVISIDDDAYFTSEDTITEAVDALEQNPSIAALALPFIEPLKQARKGRGLDRRKLSEVEVRSFRGCSHAIRRKAAIEAGGYRAYFVHQGEERDLCIRLRDLGWQIVKATTPPIVHCVSPTRDQKRMDLYGVRNTLLFDWLNTPQPYVLPRLLLDAVSLLTYKLSFSNLFARLQYVFMGLAACRRFRSDRRPVRKPIYRRYRQLPGHGPESWLGPPPKPVAE